MVFLNRTETINGTQSHKKKIKHLKLKFWCYNILSKSLPRWGGVFFRDCGRTFLSNIFRITIIEVNSAFPNLLIVPVWLLLSTYSTCLVLLSLFEIIYLLGEQLSLEKSSFKVVFKSKVEEFNFCRKWNYETYTFVLTYFWTKKFRFRFWFNWVILIQLT